MICGKDTRNSTECTRSGPFRRRSAAGCVRSVTSKPGCRRSGELEGGEHEAVGETVRDDLEKESSGEAADDRRGPAGAEIVPVDRDEIGCQRRQDHDEEPPAPVLLA